MLLNLKHSLTNADEFEPPAEYRWPVVGDPSVVMMPFFKS